jgi:hypothetical protein
MEREVMSPQGIGITTYKSKRQRKHTVDELSPQPVSTRRGGLTPYVACRGELC